MNHTDIIIRSKKIRALIEEYKDELAQKNARITELENKQSALEKTAKELEAEKERMREYETKWVSGQKMIAQIMIDAHREADRIRAQAVEEKEAQLENVRVFARILEGFEDAALGMAETMRNELGIIKKKSLDAADLIASEPGNTPPAVISEPEGQALSGILDDIMNAPAADDDGDETTASFDARAMYRAIREATGIPEQVQESDAAPAREAASAWQEQDQAGAAPELKRAEGADTLW